MGSHNDQPLLLILCAGIGFVVLRRTGLYRTHLSAQRDAPAHRELALMRVLSG